MFKFQKNIQLYLVLEQRAKTISALVNQFDTFLESDRTSFMVLGVDETDFFTKPITVNSMTGVFNRADRYDVAFKTLTSIEMIASTKLFRFDDSNDSEIPQDSVEISIEEIASLDKSTLANYKFMAVDGDDVLVSVSIKSIKEVEPSDSNFSARDIFHIQHTSKDHILIQMGLGIKLVVKSN